MDIIRKLPEWTPQLINSVIAHLIAWSINWFDLLLSDTQKKISWLLGTIADSEENVSEKQYEVTF